MAESILWALAEWAIRATALAAVAALLLWGLRIRDVAVRLAAWTAVLAGVLLVPIASLLTPQLSIPIHRPPPAIRPLVREYPPPEFMTKLTADAGVPPAPVAPARREPVLNWPAALVFVWLAVAVAMLARLSLGVWLSRKLVRGSREIRRGVRESAAMTVPVTVGILRPVTLLPPDWSAWEPGKLAVVLAHEKAHELRRDPAGLLVAAVYRSVCWFHPLAWWLCAHLGELAEAASDDAALRTTGDWRLYAETLVEFFGRADRRVEWAGAAITSGGKKATRRIERILDTRRRLSTPLARGAVITLLAAALPLVYVTASVWPVWAVMPPPVAMPVSPPRPSVVPTSTERVSLKSPAQPVVQANDPREVVIINFAGEDRWQIPIWSFKDVTLSSEFPLLADVDPKKAKTGISYGAWREADGVKVKVIALVGEPSDTGGRAASILNIATTTETPLGVFSVPSSGSTVVDPGIPGLPVLRFHLGRDPERCLGNVENVKVTPSLKAEGFPNNGGTCYLRLRNLSSKVVLSAGLAESGGSGPQQSFFYPWVVKPPLEFSVLSHKPGQTGDVRGRHLAVSYCLFTDGSYEGDAELAKRALAQYAAMSAQSERVVSFLRPLLARHLDESQFVDEVRRELSRLTESDPALEEKLVDRLKPENVPELRRSVQSGFSAAQSQIASKLQHYDRYHAMAPPTWDSILSWTEAEITYLKALRLP